MALHQVHNTWVNVFSSVLFLSTTWSWVIDQRDPQSCEPCNWLYSHVHCTTCVPWAPGSWLTWPLGMSCAVGLDLKGKFLYILLLIKMLWHKLHCMKYFTIQAIFHHRHSGIYQRMWNICSCNNMFYSQYCRRSVLTPQIHWLLYVREPVVFMVKSMIDWVGLFPFG